MEYICVVFPKTRQVFIDGQPAGLTNTTLVVNRGRHRIDLGEPWDYEPSYRRVNVQGTTVVAPMHVRFGILTEEQTVELPQEDVALEPADLESDMDFDAEATEEHEAPAAEAPGAPEISEGRRRRTRASDIRPRRSHRRTRASDIRVPTASEPGPITHAAPPLSPRRGARASDIYVPHRAPAMAAEPPLAGPDAAPVVNTGFAPTERPRDIVDPEGSLESGREYFFEFWVGQHDPRSMEERPAGIPAEVPAGARLKVALFSFPDQLELEPGADVGEIEVCEDRTAIVLRQPGDNAPEPRYTGLPARRLLFLVRTPRKAGVCGLRCSLYWGQVLVQSRRITAPVGVLPPELRSEGLRSVLDYSLSASLDSRLLESMGDHHLSLMVNDDGKGTHQFRVIGRGDYKREVNIKDAQLTTMLKKAREALRTMSWGGPEPYDRNNSKHRYKYYRAGQGEAATETLKNDLVQLATVGNSLYDDLLECFGEDDGQLPEMLRAPGCIQFASRLSPRELVPVAILYDRYVDSKYAKKPAGASLCPAYLEALRAPDPLENCKCFKGECPSIENRDVVCPSGFWGYRHRLGVPFSVAEDGAEAGAGGSRSDFSPDLGCNEEETPLFAMSVATDLDPGCSGEHLRKLDGIVPGGHLKPVASRDDTLALMSGRSQHPFHVLYFYCHGGTVNGNPCICVGPQSDAGITKTDLSGQVPRWSKPAPLVFVNGCHTAELAPGAVSDLVSGFVRRAGAAGVVGTEITIFESLAGPFAEEFWRSFLNDREPIGEAVRRARLALLKRGNPLGLVYVPYALASLTLRPH